MQYDVNGLVIHETPVGENDSWLDVLTYSAGRISIYARGVRRYTSRNRDATLPLSYSTFTIDRRRADFQVLIEAKRIETYGEIRELGKSALSMYIAEVLREFALPDQPDDRLFRLALNSLHAILKDKYPLRHIKAAFELRVMADEGYEPDVSACGTCGSAETDDMFFDVMNGALVCSSCLAERQGDPTENVIPEDGTATILLPASRATAAAMRFIISAPVERVFAFRLTDACTSELAVVAETFILNHLERGFPTLDFYKQVERL